MTVIRVTKINSIKNAHGHNGIRLSEIDVDAEDNELEESALNLLHDMNTIRRDATLRAIKDDFGLDKEHLKATQSLEECRVELEECLKATVAVLDRALEELRLIRSKDTSAVYDVLIRTDAALAIQSAQKVISESENLTYD